MAIRDGIYFSMEGFDEVAAAFRDLAQFAGKAAQRNAMKRTLLLAAEPIAARAQQFAPKRTGRSAEKFIVSDKLDGRAAAEQKQMDGSRKDREINTVRVFVGEEAQGRPVLLWSEFGTAPRRRGSRSKKSGRESGRSGGYTGAMPARPALRPAVDAAGMETINKIMPELKIQIEKAAERARRRHEKKAAKATAL